MQLLGQCALCPVYALWRRGAGNQTVMSDGGVLRVGEGRTGLIGMEVECCYGRLLSGAVLAARWRTMQRQLER